MHAILWWADRASTHFMSPWQRRRGRDELPHSWENGFSTKSKRDSAMGGRMVAGGAGVGVWGKGGYQQAESLIPGSSRWDQTCFSHSKTGTELFRAGRAAAKAAKGSE